MPQPVFEFGGFRVDTGNEKEVCRWVFADVSQELRDLGRSIREPRYLLKLFGTADELAAALPAGWAIEGGNWFMRLDAVADAGRPLPAGYRLEKFADGPVTKVEVRTPSGELAASGYAAETPDAFVYDRIVTESAHRRRGLGRAVMAALASCRRSTAACQLLVATAEGKALYSTLGWETLSPYATAAFDGAAWAQIVAGS